jgi:hypothetical protein
MLYNDPFKVKQVAIKYICKGIHLMTIRGYSLTLKRCFNIVVSDGTYTIVLVLREEVEIN